MKVVCILNSDASYERIKNEIHLDGVNWQHEKSIERLRLTLATDFYDLAIVDHSIPDFDEYIEILDLKRIKMIIFKGKYDEIILEAERKIKEILLIEEKEERSYNEHLSASAEAKEPLNVQVREVIRTERIEVPIIQNMANSIISVVNLSERAGSTFVSSNMARAFAKRDTSVTLIESPIGTIDAYYTMGLYDESKSFYSFRKAIIEQGRMDKGKLPNIKGISVAVNEPDFDVSKWDEKDSFRLFTAHSGINIVDIGWNYADPSIREIINISTTILVVVDPTLTQIARNEERLMEFDRLKQNGADVKFVFNKWDSTINKKQFEKGFNLQSYLTIPYLNPASIYESYYKSHYEFPIDNKGIGETLDECYHPLLKEYLSEDIQLEHTKRRGLIFGRRK